MLDIKIEGIKKLKVNIKKFKRQLSKELVKAVEAGAQVIAEDMIARAPTGATGELKKSIVVKVVKKSQYFVIVEVGPTVYYWKFVEMGHVIRKSKRGNVLGHVSPIPFVRPALDENKARAVEVIKEHLARSIIRKVA